LGGNFVTLTMKKSILIFTFISCLSGLNAQVQSGTLVESGRVIVGTGAFTIESVAEGTVIVELAVNRKGEVTSSKIIPDGTTIVSTPQQMKAQNVSKKLKFTPGTRYAEFEHVRVKYTYVKKK